MVKNLPAMQEIQVHSLGLGKSPRVGHGKALQYSCLGNPMQRGAWGYSPWGHKQSDTTEKAKYSAL